MTKQLRSTLSLVVCILLCSHGPFSAQQPARARDLAIAAVTVIDVRSGALLPDRTVIIAGNQISHIAPRTEAKIPVSA